MQRTLKSLLAHAHILRRLNLARGNLRRVLLIKRIRSRIRGIRRLDTLNCTTGSAATSSFDIDSIYAIGTLFIAVAYSAAPADAFPPGRR